MPQSHRDHGVAAQRHWLLDEELSSSSNGRLARPAVLARTEPPRAPGLATAEVTLPPRRNFVLLLAGLVAALLVYALLSSAVVGALDEVFPSDESGPLRITATFEEPAPRELAELRTLLARTPAVATRERGVPRSPTGATNEKPATPGPGETDDGVLPPLPPPTAPPPLVPEVELPPVEAPPLPELEAPELPPLRELPKLPELP